MKRKVRFSILFLFFLLFGLLIGLFLVRKKVFFLPRAIEGSRISLKNSYIFASPLKAKADGREKIRITVFILDTEGKGAANKPVFLGQDKRLVFTPVQSITDSFGRAIFDISATAMGNYFIEAKVDNQVLAQKIKVSFR